jgi:hypothetical protein
MKWAVYVEMRVKSTKDPRRSPKPPKKKKKKGKEKKRH